MHSEKSNSQTDARQYAPATERNREPILGVLKEVLPTKGTVLEIASGTGEHATFFAPQLSHLHWQPSEMNPLLIESIRAWAIAQPTPNLLAPIKLDVSIQPWPVEGAQAQQDPTSTKPTAINIPSAITAIVNVNMIHISPWESCEHLMSGAERILPKGGLLYLYGPYKRNSMHTAPSNEAFDEMLKSRNSRWGVRDLEAVCDVAQQHHLALSQVIPMPANNFSVVFHRQ
ncbi:MAG: DUF938 domain-containing protein [Cyanobacteria bacterium P01_D01_bin.56]